MVKYNRFENYIKVQVWILVALGYGFLAIQELMAERREKHKRSGDVRKPVVPSQATISRWIRDYKDQFVKDELRNNGEKFKLFKSLLVEWDGFDMPDGVPLESARVLMEFKEWNDYPMDSRFEPYYYATHFHKELARWIYLVLSVIPEQIGIVESKPSYEPGKESIYHLGAVEKDEILLWAEKLMYFDLAHRFLGADKPTGIVESISRKYVDIKEWKYQIYQSMNLDVLALQYFMDSGVLEDMQDQIIEDVEKVLGKDKADKYRNAFEINDGYTIDEISSEKTNKELKDFQKVAKKRLKGKKNDKK